MKTEEKIGNSKHRDMQVAAYRNMGKNLVAKIKVPFCLDRSAVEEFIKESMRLVVEELSNHLTREPSCISSSDFIGEYSDGKFFIYLRDGAYYDACRLNSEVDCSEVIPALKKVGILAGERVHSVIKELGSFVTTKSEMLDLLEEAVAEDARCLQRHYDISYEEALREHVKMHCDGLAFSTITSSRPLPEREIAKFDYRSIRQAVDACVKVPIEKIGHFEY